MNTRTLKVLLSSCALAASAFMSGYASAQSATSASSDEEIVKAVKAALTSKPELNAGNLKVSSKNGEVTIAGKVDDGQQLYKIATTAEKVQGVKAVINDMQPEK